jgi:hypothetical protein
MGWVHELSHSAGVLAGHNPDCLGASAADIAPCTAHTPFTPYPNTSIDKFGRDGLNIRHLLQLPVQLTLSARNLHCHFVLMHLCVLCC